MGSINQGRRGAGQLAAGPRVGHRVCGRYRIESEAGAGGFARVFHARAPDGRAVAVKVLRNDPVLASVRLTLFDRETRVLTRMRHPGIVRLIDAGRSGGQPVLILDWIEGETLRARLDRGPVDPRQAVSIAHALLDALDHAHTSGVVHRDLKPSNVMLRPDGRPVLVDFGFASSRDDDGDEPLRRLGLGAGNLAYLAPERLTGAPDGPAADLYSVGAILHEMLTGRRPFEGTSEEVVRAHLDRAVPSIGAVGLDCALAMRLDAVIRRAMAKKPGDRFASAAAMRAALATDDGPRIEAPPTLRLSNMQNQAVLPLAPLRPKRRGRGLAFALTLLALALAIAGASAASSGGPERDPAIEAE